MTPDELARPHPRLLHLTAAGNGRRILEHGLLPTRDLLAEAHLTDNEKEACMTRRRSLPIQVMHPRIGRVVINDNIPLHEGKLARCLDDNLSPADWLRMLNNRVFFFTRSDRLKRLMEARANQQTGKDLLVFDTLGLVSAYAQSVEISPINTGNTNHKPARRGKDTFASLLETDYQTWRRRRGNRAPDRIAEVAVCGSILNAADYLVSFAEAEAP